MVELSTLRQLLYNSSNIDPYLVFDRIHNPLNGALIDCKTKLIHLLYLVQLCIYPCYFCTVR